MASVAATYCSIQLVYAYFFTQKRGEWSDALGATLGTILLVVLWAVLQLLSGIGPEFTKVSQWFSVLWTLPGVVIAYVLYAGYSLNSGDKMPIRMLLLALSFIPFVGVGIANSATNMQELQTATALWNNPSHRTVQANTATPPVVITAGQPNKQVKIVTGTDNRLATNNNAKPVVVAMSSSSKSNTYLTNRLTELMADGGTQKKPLMFAQKREEILPPKLTNAGPGLNVLLLLLGIAYVATLHARAVRRNA